MDGAQSEYEQAGRSEYQQTDYQPSDGHFDYSQGQQVLGDSTNIPDYNERLGYGTDQGRWLVQQVGTRGSGADGAKRRSTRPPRAFHEMDESSMMNVPLRPEKPEKPEAQAGQVPFWAVVAGGVASFGLIWVGFWLLKPQPF